MCAGVLKSGSPISRWMTSRPSASISLARASTENAVSVPRRATPAASEACVPSTGGGYARDGGSAGHADCDPDPHVLDLVELLRRAEEHPPSPRLGVRERK